MIYRAFVRFAAVVWITLAIAACGGGDGGQESETQSLDDRMALKIYKQMAQASQDVPAFEIVSNMVSDSPEMTVVEDHVVILDEPSEENVQALLDHHYTRLAAQGGFEHRATPSDIIVLIYSSAEALEQNPDSWIGKAIKRTNDSEPQKEIRVN